MGTAEYCLITILDTISETSMPLNEFVIYRLNHYPTVKQYVIVCDTEERTTMQLPDNLSVVYVGQSSNNMKKNVIKILAECKEYDMNVIVHLHQIKSALAFFKSTILMKRKFSVLFTVHSVYALRNIKYRFASTLLALLSDKTACVSESSYNTYSPIAKLLKGKTISAIQNGVDTQRIESVLQKINMKTNSNKKPKTLVYVGRIIPIKNQQYLIDLMPELYDCNLVLIGAEDEKKELRALINRKGLNDRVRITGMISRESVFEELANSDIYVSSSTVEGLPVSVLEAMCVGLPVVVSEIEPHKELANAIPFMKVINLHDRESWINQLKGLIEMNKEELTQIGAQCRMDVFNHFTLCEMHRKYDVLYGSLNSR